VYRRWRNFASEPSQLQLNSSWARIFDTKEKISPWL
jgi:hypothetical protein